MITLQNAPHSEPFPVTLENVMDDPTLIVEFCKEHGSNLDRKGVDCKGCPCVHSEDKNHCILIASKQLWCLFTSCVVKKPVKWKIKNNKIYVSYRKNPNGYKVGIEDYKLKKERSRYKVLKDTSCIKQQAFKLIVDGK